MTWFAVKTQRLVPYQSRARAVVLLDVLGDITFRLLLLHVQIDSATRLCEIIGCISEGSGSDESTRFAPIGSVGEGFPWLDLLAWQRLFGSFEDRLWPLLARYVACALVGSRRRLSV